MVRVDRPAGEATSSALVEVAAAGPGAPRWPGQVRDCPPFNAIRLPQQNVKVRSARLDTLFVVFRGGGRRIVLQGVAARDLVTPAPRFHARCAGRSSSAPSAQPFTVRSPCCSGSWPCARTCPSVTLERASGSTSSKPAAVHVRAETASLLRPGSAGRRTSHGSTPRPDRHRGALVHLSKQGHTRDILSLEERRER